jgi:C1A family cysteine protease/PKD repeat protein
MSKKTSMIKMWTGVLAVVMILGFGIAGTIYGKDGDDPQMTGLPEFTPEELQYQNMHHLRVKNVKLNQLGLTRVNGARKAKGLNKLSKADVDVVEIGNEIEGTVGAAPAPDDSTTQIPGGNPLTAVDNSALKYFPPISSQGSFGSCGVYSGTYYAMTYMNALARDLDAKTGGDANRLSPKWTYNMVNGGNYTNGSWYYWAYEIGQKNGCATFAEFPYNGSTSDPANYRAWSMDPTVWRNAISRRFDQFGYVDGTNTDYGIDQVKQLLINGYILNIPTYISSWQWKTIGNDPATTADDAFAGKNCAYWVNGTSGYHGMTVVGYNDDIWVDINGNGVVDTGEKGAFRIANSWGTGWGEAGFAWMAYDALKNPSAVSGGPSTGRVTGWSPSRAHWVTAQPDYQPTLVAEFTLRHQLRNQLRMSLGISDRSRSTPTTTWPSVMINNAKYSSGPYAFDGSTTAVEGTFVLDFTDIAPAGSGSDYRYYVGMYDSASGSPAELLSYQLIDVSNSDIETVSPDVPKVADAAQVYAYADYYYNDGNSPPVAVASATPVSGQAPLEVTFNGSGSSDRDGTIASYSWAFGDGSSQAGSNPAVSHIYTSAGAVTATLTVTDNTGATDQDTVSITVSPDPSKVVYVSDIVMSKSQVKGGNTATAVVTINDVKGKPVSGATVTGNWTGVITGTASLKTGSDGKATFVSKKIIKKGMATFAVTGVSLSGYTYNSGLNAGTSDSVTLP